MPKLFVAIVGSMWRYLFVITDEVRRCSRAQRRGTFALNGRRAGSLAWRARVTGGMAGSLLLRFHERSDRIYAAMLSRGYNGVLPAQEVAHFRGRCGGFSGWESCCSFYFGDLLCLSEVEAWKPSLIFRISHMRIQMANWRWTGSIYGCFPEKSCAGQGEWRWQNNPPYHVNGIFTGTGHSRGQPGHEQTNLGKIRALVGWFPKPG